MQVTFEERTWAAWLHDMLKPNVTRTVVSDTLKTGVGKQLNRNDCQDARGRARLMLRDELESVYHGEHGLRELRELARIYPAIMPDLTKAMTHVNAIAGVWGFPVPAAGPRASLPGGIAREAGGKRRASAAEFYHQQFDALAGLRQQARGTRRKS